MTNNFLNSYLKLRKYSISFFYLNKVTVISHLEDSAFPIHLMVAIVWIHYTLE